MNEHFKERIVELTGASALGSAKKIQSLWGGYGSIDRWELKGASVQTVVAKHVKLPRGLAGDVGHERKLKSYDVEMNFYRDYASECNDECRVARCFGSEIDGDEFLMVLEDLKGAGYDGRAFGSSNHSYLAILKWLAHFHATFMGVRPKGLWKVGSYWQLETRPDELRTLARSDKALSEAAKKIDSILRGARFQTLIHGDAKMTNFCFSSDGKKVAGVDFQYVGGGCGMKDVAYLIDGFSGGLGSRQEEQLLEFYFDELEKAFESRRSTTNINFKELKSEWTKLYRFAWLDFYRFLKGWSPGYYNSGSSSERMAKEILGKLK